MSLQILNVVVYNQVGESRVLEFRPGALNILSGGSRTGKTAIIDIVDYCMGKGSCSIPVRIQRSVSWFAVHFTESSQELFIARPSPKFSGTSTGDIYIERGRNIGTPDSSSLQKNISLEELRSLLSRESGIRDNVHVPKAGQTRLPLTANIRHALWLCIQDQNDIDHRSKLFHGMDSTFSMNDLRHTLPYFLGAIDEDRLIVAARLESALRERRQLVRQAATMHDQQGDTESETTSLIEEARIVGLVAEDEIPTSNIESIGILESISQMNMEGEVEPVTSGDPRIAELVSARTQLRRNLEALRRRIHEVRLFSQEHTSFDGEARQHRARLASIQLFRTVPDNANTCPVCSSELSVSVPTVEQIQESLARVTSVLENSEVASPRLTQHLAELTSEEQSLLRQLRENATLTRRLERTNDQASATYQDSLAQMRVIGKVEQYLAMHGIGKVGEEIQSQIDKIDRLISNLESELSHDRVQENVDTYLNFVSEYITSYAKSLSLEYSDHRIRLDLGRLTLVADTRQGAVPMHEMGSGENWVGYHIVAHLGLHRWFRENSRPVPGFLLLDQPSQAHYPRSSSSENDLVQSVDEDDVAVQEIYRLLRSFAESLTPTMQVIVLDHPRFEEFDANIVEEWRDGRALLPQDWLVDPSDEDEDEG